MKPITKILVPVDFSEMSLKTLDEALELAASLSASVVVMHAYEIPTVGLLPDGALLPGGQEAAGLATTAQSALEGVLASRAGRGLALQGILREGPAWQEIDTVARESGADLIVMGTHGRQGVMRALLGSTTEKVVRTAHTPVLTLRPLDT